MRKELTVYARAIVEGELPSGRKIKLRELSGAEEISALAEAGDVAGPVGNYRIGIHQIHRAMVSINGTPVDQSTISAEGLRDLFSAKEWQCVIEMFSILSRPSEAEMASFRRGLQFTVVDAPPVTVPAN